MKIDAMEDKDTLTLAPDDTSYPLVQDFLTHWLESAEVPLRVQTRVQVVTDEIWSNIVHYSGATQASISLRIEDCALSLSFADNGKPYDPTAVPEPDITLSAQEREIGGLGLHMVRKMTASMTYAYAKGENHLVLYFAL